MNWLLLLTHVTDAVSGVRELLDAYCALYGYVAVPRWSDCASADDFRLLESKHNTDARYKGINVFK